MSGLPLLPGYNIDDPQTRARPLRQSLNWRKGAPLVSENDPSHLLIGDDHDLERQERQLQFGHKRRPRTPPRFLPEWALLDKKVLRFRGYFSEHVEGSGQVYRVRPVLIYYYLLDDALSIMEPKTSNSGLDQGRLLSRQRVPHPEGGFWHWTHLNLGKTLNLYGRHYVICDCDPFTKEYLLSEGTEVGPPLAVPCDPYSMLRQSRAESPTRISDLRPHSAPVAFRHRGTVLKFDVVVEESDGGAVSAVLLYRPTGQTVEMRLPANIQHMEIKRFSPVILRPVRVPLTDSGKGAFVDIGEEGRMEEWLTPRHLIPPAILTIFGRRVLVTGCDDATQMFLLHHYGADNIPSMKQIDNTKPDESGSSGKTQSDIVPRHRPRRGLLDTDDATILRFSAKLDCPDGEDSDRSFILSYHVVDATMELTEKPRPGGLGGRLLSRSRVPKPESKDEKHKAFLVGYNFYTLDDLCIGSTLNIWGRHYKITGTDRYVLNYIRQHEGHVSSQLMLSLQNFFMEEANRETVDENDK